MQAAPGNGGCVPREVESDAGRICALCASARGSVEERGAKGVRVQDTLPPSCLKAQEEARWAGTSSPSLTSRGASSKSERTVPIHNQGDASVFNLLEVLQVGLPQNSGTFFSVSKCLLCLESGGEHSPPAKVVQRLTSGLYRQTT